jgi:hypothetical protein
MRTQDKGRIKFMRKSVLWNGFHVRLSLAIGIALLVSLMIAGCGGGGGSSSGGGGGTTTPSLAIVSGTVQDDNGNNVTGATVSIVGTSLAASSGSNGKFQINNVPLTAKTFQVTVPTSYFTIGTISGVNYQFNPTTTPCSITLPTLQASSAGTTVLPTVTLYPSGGTSPPPSPPSPLVCSE